MFSLGPKATQLSGTLESPGGIMGVKMSTCRLLVPAGRVFFTPEQSVLSEKQALLRLIMYSKLMA